MIRITIERETAQADIGALEAYEAVTGRKSAVLAHLRAALAAQPAEPVAWPREADPFTYIIQHLNSSTYNLTKAECIHFIGELRDRYAAPPAPAAVPLTDELIKDLWIATCNNTLKNGWDRYLRFARAVLAAAGEKP